MGHATAVRLHHRKENPNVRSFSIVEDTFGSDLWSRMSSSPQHEAFQGLSLHGFTLSHPEHSLPILLGVTNGECQIALDSHLPIEEGRRSRRPQARRVCNLCNIGALGDESHMLLECPVSGLRLQFSSLLLSCSGVMRRLLWAKDQHALCRYIIACLDNMSSHGIAPPRRYSIRSALLAARDE